MARKFKQLQDRDRWTRGFSFKLIDKNEEDITEDDRAIIGFLQIIYQSKPSNLDKIYITCSFRLGGKPVRIGYSNGKHNSLQTSNDNEVREQVRKLLKENPTLSAKDIRRETKYSLYRINRVYMPTKRELYR